MKLYLFLAALSCSLLQIAQAQTPTDQYKFYDASWKPAREKKAVYLLRIRHLDDSCWQYSYYNMYGPLIRIESYQDQKATIRHGLFAWYNEEGKQDSSGHYDHDIREGSWHFASTKSKAEVYYENGRLLNEKELKEKLISLQIQDPAYPDFSRESPEAYFPGGSAGWAQYLNTHLRYPQRAVGNFVKGTVILWFIVQPTGKVEDIRLWQSVEISLDDEALHMITGSPDWIPAIRLDKKVRAINLQPVVFRLQVGS